MRFDCIVAGCHLRYDGTRQRPQHVLSRLAERVPVLVVEEPLLGESDADEIVARDGLWVLRPKRCSLGPLRIDAATLDAVRAWAAGRVPLVWLYTPMLSELVSAFAASPVVFDCMDDLAAFDFAPAGIAQRERELIERADLVFAGGRMLYERRAAAGGKVRLYRSGVEFEHFAQARELAPHPLCVPLRHPIAGYIGVIDERLDLRLVNSLAERDVQIVLAGPVVKIDPGLLPRRENVHFTGALSYGELPGLLAGFDVALMPFALNRATASISPTKTPEYLAAGLPVVSTPVPDVVRDWNDVVIFPAEGADAFAEQVLRAAGEPPLEAIARGIRLARDAGWHSVVGQMWNDLKREG